MRTSLKGYSRARGLRQNMSLPEVILWQHLRGGNVHGLRFRRQHPVGPFVIDFFCAARKLAIEVDGRAHDVGRVTEDEQRTMWLNNQGIRVIRFLAADILDDASLEGVMERIRETTATPTSFAGPPPPPRGGGSR